MNGSCSGCRYSFLCRYKIETPEKLRGFIDTKNTQRRELENQRGKVYNKMKCVKTPEQKDALIEQRNKLSDEIKVIRRELFYSGDIEKRHEEIRRQIKAQRELDSGAASLKFKEGAVCDKSTMSTPPLF